MPTPSDDSRHVRIVNVLRVLGPLLALLGLGLVVVGFGSFLTTFSSFGSAEFGPPRYFWCAFVGMPLLIFGAGLSMPAYLGSVARFVNRETAPVQRDAFNAMARGTAPGVRTIAEAVSEGIRAANSSDNTSRCDKCGSPIPAGARFCPGCGVPFRPEVCRSCGEAGPSSARFCPHCGAPRETEELA